MLKSSFYKIVSLTVLHNYYTGNVCKDLKYEPAKESGDIINKYGFKIIITAVGFELYVDRKENFSNLLNYITSTTGETTFKFHASTLNPLFYQFTELPINEIGITHFNTDNAIENVETNKLILTPSFRSTNSADYLFEFTIRFEDLIKLNDEKKEANYEIKFEARATQWKYYIVNTTGQHLGKLSIKDTSGIQFSGPEQILLPNEQKAQLFSLVGDLLPFSEKPIYTFDLISNSIKNGVERSKVVFKGLPKSNPKEIAINEELLSSKITSLMYVYI
ncbi:hypothetical protein ACSIGC_03795 [Tenacibaculum sp. ZS6-P6]|uniref:hypothetical protein n=1 Tax=Tenacibaculum sp. ZS6-P6 TaxID=3447503 RepID=UPI003F9D2DEF